MANEGSGPARSLVKLMKAPDRQPWIYHLVLAGLFVSFMLQPVADDLPLGGVIVRGTYLAIVLGAIVAASDRPALLIPALVLALPSVLLRSAFAGGYSIVMADVAMIGLMLVVIGIFLVRILSHRVVTMATISGALSVYLLIGVTWTILYVVLETVQPCSFNGIECATGMLPGAEPVTGAQSALFYYSFVTLSTLGYGDISPATEAARTAASLEAVVGQLYLVVLVARLVGLINVGPELELDVPREAGEIPVRQLG